MLKTKLTERRESGFTIIEILIVLAIAALILLIVFLAVPSLERSSRNNGRKNDASRVATAISNFASNSNGALPPLATWNNDCNVTFGKDIGQLSQYGLPGNPSITGAWCGGNNGNAPANNVFNAEAGVVAQVTNITDNMLELDENTTCNGNAGAAYTPAVGSSRQAIILYSLEVSNGNWTIACLQAL